MSKIRILTTLSIDGFYVPQKWQKSFGFGASQYKNLCQDADAVLINKDEYKNLREIELDCGKPVYAIQKDRSLMLYGNAGESRSLTIEELENEGKKTMVVIGNNRELINVLVNKGNINEICIYLFPLLLGKGKRVFPASPEYSLWKIKSRQLYDSGITTLHYIRE